MAENKNLPKIRFAGFEEEWNTKPLSYFSDLLTGNPFESDSFTKDGIFLVRGMNVKRGYLDTSKEISEFWPSSKGLEKYLLEENDILIQMDGALIGKSYAEVKIEHLPALLVQRVTRIRNTVVNSNIIYQNIQKSFLNYIQSIKTETAVPHLSLNDIRSFLCSVPNDKQEQSQIGTYFQNLDKLISLHKRKCDKLVILKKAMLEKMFPKNGATVPEIRFKGFEGDWDLKRFGECVLIQRGGSPRPIEKFMTDDENGVNWIKIGDVSKNSRYITQTKEKIISEGIKHSREVFKGDLILSNSMSFGRPYIMAIDGCIHDGWLLIRDENKLFNLEYLLQLLSSDYMLKQYKALASGSVVINLNSELVQSTNVYVPHKEEQKQIGNYFHKLDQSISLQQKQLNKLNTIKKACLEKMFV